MPYAGRRKMRLSEHSAYISGPEVESTLIFQRPFLWIKISIKCSSGGQFTIFRFRVSRKIPAIMFNYWKNMWNPQETKLRGYQNNHNLWLSVLVKKLDLPNGNFLQPITHLSISPLFQPTRHSEFCIFISPHEVRRLSYVQNKLPTIPP